MRTSDETIRELERLNAERTQGEWNFANSNSMRRLGANGYDGNIAHGIKDRGGVPDIQIRDEDGACIAAAVNALPNLLADLRDLAAMEQRDRDGPCYYCGEPTQRFAGAPSRWPVYLCHADEPGVAKPHHAGCVSERLKERDAAIRERDEARAAFDKYGEHFQNCATNAFQQFDPGPPRRWKYGGEWMSSIPTCTCGLDAAIGGQG